MGDVAHGDAMAPRVIVGARVVVVDGRACTAAEKAGDGLWPLEPDSDEDGDEGNATGYDADDGSSVEPVRAGRAGVACIAAAAAATATGGTARA